MNEPVNIFWFRRDLRLHDNAGLYHALQDEHPVLPIFIFDKNILDQLEEKNDSRVEFIRHSLITMQRVLQQHGASLEVLYDFPDKAFAYLLKKYKVKKVFTNHDYEPYAKERDEEIKQLLNKSGVSFYTYKDQVIFEKDEIVKDDGSPYVVFTPYSKRWRAKLDENHLQPFPAEEHFDNFLKHDPLPIPSLENIGFTKGDKDIPSQKPPEEIIRKYKEQRDYPGIDGTSRMGIHLRFGTISIRELVRAAKEWSDTYLNELIWREFYQMILWQFPHVGKGRAFKREFDLIEWRNDEKEFELWCEGKTGYPIVDAGIRQLNQTGFMHNRVRMITASFLTKHLLIDWRWGEAYFAQKLLDYDLASNNGGWQWAAGCGCDAAPYFRIFNPGLQTKKFDPEFRYIRKWVPEFENFGYPRPIVDHEFARKRCIDAYTKALKSQE